MDLRRWDPGDGDDAVRDCHDVWLAAHETDDPRTPAKPLPVLRTWMERGWRGYGGEVWLASDSGGTGTGTGGTVSAWYRLGLPNRGKPETADLKIWVHPRARRRGTGTLLLRHAAQRATANRRTLLTCQAPEGSAGAAFAEGAGATRGLAFTRRRLRLAEVPPGTLARLHDEATRKAGGYTVTRWAGSAPEEYAGMLAGVYEAMNDAPSDTPVRRAWDADRVRRMEAGSAAFGARRYSVAARHHATGEIVALTQVTVDPEPAVWGHQVMTAVTRAHRGHRLGLLVKTEILQWLAEAEPRLRHVDTGNAEGNTHIIALNDALGYKVFAPDWISYQLPAEKVTQSWT